MITYREHKEKEVRVYSNDKLALVGRLSRLFYVLTAEKEFFGELDLYDLPPVFFNGVFEVTAHYGRVCVKNGRWRKAEVDRADQQAQQRHGMRGPGEPKQATRMRGRQALTRQGWQAIGQRRQHGGNLGRLGRARIAQHSPGQQQFLAKHRQQTTEFPPGKHSFK